MVRSFESKGLKTERRFENYIDALRKVRESSNVIVEEHRQKPKKEFRIQQPKASGPKVRIQNAEYEHLIIKNPHETDDNFQFTKNAVRTAHNKTKKHMHHIVSNIRYENNHPEKVVKYLTGNPIFYSNTTERKISVAVRGLPVRSKKLDPNDKNLVELRGKKQLSVVLLKTREDRTTYLEDNLYDFQRVFEEAATNSLVYSESVAPVVTAVLANPNRCALCVSFGPRKSGKTYTLFGAIDQNQKLVPGVTHEAVKQILEQSQRTVTLKISLYEIYLGKIYDLLNNGNDDIQLKEKDDQAVIEGLSEHSVRSYDQFCRLLQTGLELRNGSLDYPNQEGSRSFVVLLLKTAELGGGQVSGSCAGQIAFVDMAAYEHSNETLHPERPIRMLATDIKKTLTAFFICSRNIEDSKKVPPFRESRLTTALQGFFSGNCHLLTLGHYIPLESKEKLLFRTLNYLNRLQKPPGEVLDLQSSKYVTFDATDHASRTNSPVKIPDYSLNRQAISDFFIDNKSDDVVAKSAADRFKISQLETKGRKLIDSINSSRLGIESPVLVMPNSPDETKSGIFVTATKVKQRPQTALSPSSGKKKRGLGVMKEGLRLKKQGELERLLKAAETPRLQASELWSPEIESERRPLSKKAGNKLSTFNQSELKSPSFLGNLPTQGDTIKLTGFEYPDEDSFGVGDDPFFSGMESDLQNIIENIDKKGKKIQEGGYLKKTRNGRYYRTPDEAYFVLERYGTHFDQNVSPTKAGNNAVKIKNKYYQSLAEQKSLTIDKSKSTDFLTTKRGVFSNYVDLSQVCESETGHNKRLRTAFSRQMDTVKHSFATMGRKLESEEIDIERRMKEDALEDYKKHNIFMPGKGKGS